MSYSHYRGKLGTNQEIKGPFTEAENTPEKAVKILSAAVERDEILDASLLIREKGKTSVFIHFGDNLWLEISEDGFVEVGEGG